MSEIGGRSRLTPRYLRGIADATPRARRRANRRSRHSHGRATSSGPRIHPDPSHTPSGQACCGSSRALASRTGRGEKLTALGLVGQVVGEVDQRRPLTRPLLDRWGTTGGAVDEARVLLEEDHGHFTGGAVAVLRDEQVGLAGI